MYLIATHSLQLWTNQTKYILTFQYRVQHHINIYWFKMFCAFDHANKLQT